MMQVNCDQQNPVKAAWCWEKRKRGECVWTAFHICKDPVTDTEEFDTITPIIFKRRLAESENLLLSYKDVWT